MVNKIPITRVLTTNDKHGTLFKFPSLCNFDAMRKTCVPKATQFRTTEKVLVASSLVMYNAFITFTATLTSMLTIAPTKLKWYSFRTLKRINIDLTKT